MNVHPNEDILRAQYRKQLCDQAQRTNRAAEARGRRRVLPASIPRSRMLVLLFILVTLVALIVTPQVSAQEHATRSAGSNAGLNSQETFWYGMYLLGEGDYSEAVTVFTDIIVDDPSDTSAYAARAIAFYYLDDYEQAITDSESALRLAPDYAPPYWVLGQVYFAQEDYSRALESYQNYLENARNHVDPLVLHRIAICQGLVAEA